MTINFGSGNSLAPSGTKSFPESIDSQDYVYKKSKYKGTWQKLRIIWDVKIKQTKK